MNDAQKLILHELIANKKTETASVLEKEYEMIAKKAIEQSPERLVQCIVQEESTRVTGYIRELRQQLKLDSSKAITDIGLSESVASIIWADVMQQVGLPKPSLCKKEDVKIQPSAPKKTQKETSHGGKYKAELKRLEEKRSMNIGITALGAVATAVTCLVVPGWTGIAGLVKGAEVVVSGTGAVGVVTTQHRIEEVNRIIAEEEKKTAANRKAATSNEKPKSDIIEKVCRHQCKMNCKIISEWLDNVEKELIAQCETELEK